MVNLSGLIDVCQLFYNYLGYSSVQLESSPMMGGGMLYLIMIGRCGEDFIKLSQTPRCLYVKNKLILPMDTMETHYYDHHWDWAKVT